LTTVLNEQPLFVQPVVKPGYTTGLTTGLTTGCIHDTTGCQTGLTTALTTVLTTGCSVYTNRLYRVNGVLRSYSADAREYLHESVTWTWTFSEPNIFNLMQATYEVTEFRQQNAHSVTFVSHLHKPLCFVARAVLLVCQLHSFSFIYSWSTVVALCVMYIDSEGTCSAQWKMKRNDSIAIMKYCQTFNKLEMWANDQRDGRPPEYRWRRLFNAAKFGWRPLLECRAVMLPRHETRWNSQGAPNYRIDLSR